MFGDAYIRDLKRRSAEIRAMRAAQAAAAIADPRAALRAKILAWQSTLSPEARAPSYLMEDLVKLLDSPPQQLGIALRELDWKCERRWRKGEAYRHYWVPPESD